MDLICSCSGTHLLSQLKNICLVRIALHWSLIGWFSNINEDFGSSRNSGCSTNGCISSKTTLQTDTAVYVCIYEHSLFSHREEKRKRKKRENYDNRALSLSLSYREYVIFNFQVVLQKKIHLPVQYIDHITRMFVIDHCQTHTHTMLKIIIDYVSAIWDEHKQKWIIKSKFKILTRDAMPVVFTCLLDFFFFYFTDYLMIDLYLWRLQGRQIFTSRF